jgi:hypothetical protein
METFIIPAIHPHLEQTGISRSKHFPCKALFALETNVNATGFRYQQPGKSKSSGKHSFYVVAVQSHCDHPLFRTGGGCLAVEVWGRFRVVPLNNQGLTLDSRYGSEYNYGDSLT